MSFSLVSTADYSQAAQCFPVNARGRQCVPSCLMFLITVNDMPCSNIRTENLNDILFAGSYLYCAICESTSASGLLDPENLPERIYYSGKTVYIRHSQVFSGFIEENPLKDGQIYHSLENAFLKATVDGKNFIIVFNGISVGLYFDGSVFYVFDSHSWDENGMSSPDGKCVLGVVQSLFHLSLCFI